MCFEKYNSELTYTIESEEKQDHFIELEKIDGKWFIKNDNVEGDFKQAFKMMEDKQYNKAALEKKQKEIIKVTKSYVNKLEQEQTNDI